MITDFDKRDLAEGTSEEDKVTRKKKFRSANTKVMGAPFNVSYNCDETKAVLTAHHQEDSSANAFKLYNMLKVRFSKKNEKRLQTK